MTCSTSRCARRGGGELGRVVDVRFRRAPRRGRREGELELIALIVSPHSRLSYYGYERGTVKGPAVIAAIVRWLHRDSCDRPLGVRGASGRGRRRARSGRTTHPARSAAGDHRRRREAASPSGEAPCDRLDDMWRSTRTALRSHRHRGCCRPGVVHGGSESPSRRRPSTESNLGVLGAADCSPPSPSLGLGGAGDRIERRHRVRPDVRSRARRDDRRRQHREDGGADDGLGRTRRASHRAGRLGAAARLGARASWRKQLPSPGRRVGDRVLAQMHRAAGRSRSSAGRATGPTSGSTSRSDRIQRSAFACSTKLRKSSSVSVGVIARSTTSSTARDAGQALRDRWLPASSTVSSTCAR